MPVSFSAAQAIENNEAPQTARQSYIIPSPERRPAPSTYQEIALENCLIQAGGKEKVSELKELYYANKSKIADLCEKGKRKIAQEYARDTATELMLNPRVVELQKCPSEVVEADPALSELIHPTGVQANHHICD